MNTEGTPLLTSNIWA